MHNGRLALLILYFLVINVLFFLPGSALPKAGWLQAVHIDKWVHAGIFALLGLLVFYNQAWWHRRRGWWLTAAAGYGLAVECAQHLWVANREFDVWDWVADVAGALLAIFIWKGLQKNRPL